MEVQDSNDNCEIKNFIGINKNGDNCEITKDVVTNNDDNGDNNDKNKNFIEFLESNLNSVIACPISGTTFFNSVTCSDGFSYEESVISEYQKQHANSKSPMTREPLSKTYYKNNLIPLLINYADNYNLEVSKDKFINGDSFEENFEIIQNYVANGGYDNVYKFKNFTLKFSPPVADQNTELFCRKILTCNIHNPEEYVKCIKHILSNSIDIEFRTLNSDNILHIFFRFCKQVELIEYLFTIISSENIQNMLQEINGSGLAPIDMAIQNEGPVFNYVIGLGINVNVTIKLLNSCILKQVNNDTIITLMSQFGDINVFDNENNLSPMFCAIRMSNIDIVNYLISNGYNMEMKSADNLNAFHYVAKCRDSKIVEYVLEMCNDFNEDSVNGWSVVHICAYHNNFESIMYLLDKFVNLTAPITNFNGENKEYFVINLIEINRYLSDEERQTLIDYVLQLMELQLY